ncbi:homologous-pairing protein 2 homolog isoform X3 [Loxodonta africana]|uniref:homologous-pairing protein 2 homolog isoform X3 n=1 Tax=Loxodonta africana TaxID=9785 RepID=UPI0030CDCEAD
MSKGRAEAAAGGNGGASTEKTWEGSGEEVLSNDSLSRLLPLHSPRAPPEIPARAEPSLQRPGRVREPAAGTRTWQGGEGPPPPGHLESGWSPALWSCHELAGLSGASDHLVKSPPLGPKGTSLIVPPPPLCQTVVKALEQLAQQGKIKEKTYGKQKIYFADQDQFDMVSDADLQGLDAKIVALTAKVQSLQQSCRHMEAELKELTSAMTTSEMQKEIQELKKECAGYTERLKNIKAATNHVTPEEKEQVYRERQKYCKEWRKRKRMATELCDAILEGYPKSKKQFFVSGTLPLPCSLWFSPREVTFTCLPAHRRKLG